MADAFSEFKTGLDSPAKTAQAVTPNDATELTDIPRALWIGGAGDLTVDMMDGGADIVFAGIQAGTLLPIRVKKVKATGTTATSIVALR